MSKKGERWGKTTAFLELPKVKQLAGDVWFCFLGGRNKVSYAAMLSNPLKYVVYVATFKIPQNIGTGVYGRLCNAFSWFLVFTPTAYYWIWLAFKTGKSLQNNASQAPLGRSPSSLQELYLLASSPIYPDCWQGFEHLQSSSSLPKQIIKNFWNSRNKVGSFQNPLVSKI